MKIFLIILGIIIIIVIVLIKKLIKIIYKYKITPTMKFILAVSSTTFLYSFKTCVDINGYRYNFLSRKFAKFLLKSGWGIENREEAFDMIDWLFSEEHNKSFLEELRFFKKNENLVEDEKIQLFEIAKDKYSN